MVMARFWVPGFIAFSIMVYCVFIYKLYCCIYYVFIVLLYKIAYKIAFFITAYMFSFLCRVVIYV